MMIYSKLDGLSNDRRTVFQISRDRWRGRLQAVGLNPDEAEVVVRYLGQEMPHSTYRQTELAGAFTWLRREFSAAGVECFLDSKT